MSFRNGYSVDLYSVRKSEFGVTGRVHAWHRDKKTEKFYTDFTGFVNFKGTAAKKALELGLPEVMPSENAPKKRIKITFGPDVTNRFIGKDDYDNFLKVARGNEKLTKFIMNNANPISVTILDFEIDDYPAKQEGKTSVGKHSNNYSNNRKSYTQSTPADDDDVQLPF